jgi:hypothetical protein
MFLECLKGKQKKITTFLIAAVFRNSFHGIKRKFQATSEIGRIVVSGW